MLVFCALAWAGSRPIPKQSTEQPLDPPASVSPVDKLASAAGELLSAMDSLEHEELADRLAGRTRLEALASAGMLPAKHELALLSLTGSNFEDDELYDPDRGILLLRELAASGYSPAMVNLGMGYLRGLDFEENPALAIEWFVRAAHLGNPIAYSNLGAMYMHGMGVDPNPGYAMTLARAALAINPDEGQAQYLVGRGNCEGLSVEKDTAKGLELLRRAATAGHADAQGYLRRFESP